jgi:hypothetical protein
MGGDADMWRRGDLKLTLLASGAALLLTAVLVWGQQAMPVSHPLPADRYDGSERDAVRSMSSGKLQSNPHIRLTELRPASEADRLYARELAVQLRAALAKYRDYHVAEQEGYQPLFPDSVLPQYYFTNDRFSLIGSLWFRPANPASLLYKKTKSGYELLGALYTASQFATEAELNRRVPLSVARWHAYINICMPPNSEYQNADWAQFGFQGSIITEQVCREAGGSFYPQLFGWMLQVYPFKKSPAKIWAD